MEGTGERSKSEGMYIYIKLIHFAVHQKPTQPMQNKTNLWRKKPNG